MTREELARIERELAQTLYVVRKDGESKMAGSNGSGSITVPVEVVTGSEDVAAAAPQPDPLIGVEVKITRVVEEVMSCKLVQRLGSGAFGVVYKATAPSGEVLAVKVLTQNDPEVVARFRNEMRVLAKLRHENIVGIEGWGQLPTGELYMAMEYVAGESLQSLLKKYRQGLPFPMIFHVAVQILRALRKAHEKGIVHRDLKPENVMVDSKDEPPTVKVLDFGIARIANPAIAGGGKLTAEWTVLGTPHYLSPEAASGNSAHVDERSDLYTLGVMLYEMATGRVPYDAEEIGKILGMHSLPEIRPIPPSQLRANMPPRLEEFILRLLEKNREARPRNAQETIRLLEQAFYSVPDPLAGTMASLSVPAMQVRDSEVRTVKRNIKERLSVVLRNRKVRAAGLILGMVGVIALGLAAIRELSSSEGAAALSGGASDPQSQHGVTAPVDRVVGPSTRPVTHPPAPPSPGDRAGHVPAVTEGARPQRPPEPTTPARPAANPSTAREEDRARLRNQCLEALDARRGFREICSLYLELDPDDRFVRRLLEVANRRAR